MDKLDFDLFMDLHNHTKWSDGADKPEDIILNAISHQVEVVGITDHFCNDDKYSLGFDKLKIYLNKIDKLKTKYSNKIKVLIGVEIAYSYLLKNYRILPYDVLNQLDFILLENLDYIPATTKLEDVANLLDGFKCSKGLAHTDLVKLAKKYEGKGELDYILDFMKQNELFWEINTDSAHDIFLNILHPSRKDEKTKLLLEGIVKRKICVSVGSDTHSLVQYDYGRLKAANEVAKLLNLGSY
ncbi:MAG: PHP domain-containing protein [Bacillota bacterium]